MSKFEFQGNGFLKPGVWTCNERQFVAQFCQTSTHRKKFRLAAQHIIDFAKSRGSHRILVGGSFVTNLKEPSDFDCVVIFQTENEIPDKKEWFESKEAIWTYSSVPKLKLR